VLALYQEQKVARSIQYIFASTYNLPSGLLTLSALPRFRARCINIESKQANQGKTKVARVWLYCYDTDDDLALVPILMSNELD
jgi:hypothetical protein